MLAQKKPKSLKNQAETAWRLMSEWTRRNEADSNGNCTCISCGRYGPYKEFDAGHFIHAGHGGKQNPVSYDPRNVHAQCSHCNRQPGAKHRHPGTTTIRYTRYMVNRYGDGVIDQLEAIKRQPWFRHQELEEQIVLLKSKLKVIEKSKIWTAPRESFPGVDIDKIHRKP